MKEKLYWPLKRPSLRYAYFLFFDTTPYLADRLFIRHKVRVWFDREYAKDGFPYLAVLCHVRKKDVPSFLAALEDLMRSMALCGHPHYAAEVSAFMGGMEHKKGAVKTNETDPPGQAEQA